MRACILALAAAGALAAQGPGQGPALPPPPDGPKQVVSGRVVDSKTSRPVRGAKVAIQHDRGELVAVHTDFEGRFKFDQAPVGEWRMSAEKSGYMNNFERLTVPAAQPLSDLELRIDRQAVITGHVVDHRNRPVVGARVAVYVLRQMDGETAYFRQGGRGPSGGQTDDRGQYRIWGLIAGSYVLAVFPAPQPAASGVLRFSAPGALYPSAQSLAEAEKIVVDWGEVREGLDLRLGPPAATRAEALLTLPGKEPCQTCFLQIFLEDSEGLIEVGGAPLSGANGIVIEGAASGRYLAHVRGFDRATSTNSSGMAHFTLLEGRTETFSLPFSSEVSIKGRVVLENPPADLFADGGMWRGSLRLTPPPSQMQLGMMARGMLANLETSEPEVPFELTSFPGTMRLRLMGPASGYVVGMSLDGVPLDSPLLTIPPGGLAGELVVRVSFETGRVEGTIEGAAVAGRPGLGGPLDIAIARPVGASSAFLDQRYMRVRPDGGFGDALPPGSWDLVALRRTGVQAMGDPAQEAILRKFTRRVEIRANQTTTVTLAPAPEP